MCFGAPPQTEIGHFLRALPAGRARHPWKVSYFGRRRGDGSPGEAGGSGPAAREGNPACPEVRQPGLPGGAAPRRGGYAG